MLLPSNPAACAVPVSDIPPGIVGASALAPLRRGAALRRRGPLRAARRREHGRRGVSLVADPLPLPAVPDPLGSAAVGGFLSGRAGNVTVAVDDLLTGQLWLYNPASGPSRRASSSSTSSETLLRQSELSGVPFDGASPAVIQGMIENSDNNDATTLWDHVGGPGAVGAYNATAGLSQTVPNGAWGLTSTSAADQIHLLCQLVLPDGLLGPSAQGYALSLMENIESDQDWGVSGGVPAGVSVALKNGWLPWGAGWEINSVGRVRGDGRYYLIAVLTANDPGEGYGIETIEGVSSLVWSSLQHTPGT